MGYIKTLLFASFICIMVLAGCTHAGTAARKAYLVPSSLPGMGDMKTPGPVKAPAAAVPLKPAAAKSRDNITVTTYDVSVSSIEYATAEASRENANIFVPDREKLLLYKESSKPSEELHSLGLQPWNCPPPQKDTGTKCSLTEQASPAAVAPVAPYNTMNTPEAQSETRETTPPEIKLIPEKAAENTLAPAAEPTKLPKKTPPAEAEPQNAVPASKINEPSQEPPVVEPVEGSKTAPESVPAEPTMNAQGNPEEKPARPEAAAPAPAAPKTIEIKEARRSAPQSSETVQRKEWTARKRLAAQNGPDTDHEARMHTALRGENLQSLAEKYYGDKSLWIKIYDANKDKIEKGSLVDGQVIIIP